MKYKIVTCCWKQTAFRQFKHCIGFDWLWTNVCRLSLFQRDCSDGLSSCFLETGLTVSFVQLLVIFASFLWLSLRSSRSPPEAVSGTIFVDVVIYEGLRKPFYLCKFSALSQTFPRPPQIFICHYVCRNRKSMWYLWMGVFFLMHWAPI